MDMKVHGCDICQEACPRNSARLKAKLPEDPYLLMLAKEFTLPKMLEMSDRFFEKTVRPVMYNDIQEKKYFRRSAHKYQHGDQQGDFRNR